MIAGSRTSPTIKIPGTVPIIVGSGTCPTLAVSVLLDGTDDVVVKLLVGPRVGGGEVQYHNNIERLRPNLLRWRYLKSHPGRSCLVLGSHHAFADLSQRRYGLLTLA